MQQNNSKPKQDSINKRYKGQCTKIKSSRKKGECKSLYRYSNCIAKMCVCIFLCALLYMQTVSGHCVMIHLFLNTAILSKLSFALALLNMSPCFVTLFNQPNKSESQAHNHCHCVRVTSRFQSSLSLYPSVKPHERNIVAVESINGESLPGKQPQDSVLTSSSAPERPKYRSP